MAQKTQAEIAVDFAQTVVRNAPVIILGSGASAAHGIPGMWGLATAIKDAAPPSGWSAAEADEWSKFIGLIDAGVDLESALAEASRLSEGQTDHVVRTTRSFLLPPDLEILGKLLVDRRTLPLSRLYTHLFRSTHSTLNVITSNYDRLAEYAADAADLAHFTGFNHGYLQARAKDPNTRLHARGHQLRTVCIWKVHGSLSWFQSPAEIVGLQGGVEPPADFKPLIVTPGLGKYRTTHDEPFRTILASADVAIDAARSYLCIGYGFNDEHLQTKLVERCERDSVPLVVITKELTASTRKFLGSGRSRFLALEESPGGTRAWSHEEPGGFDIHGVAYWRLPDFLDMTIGVAP